MTDTHSSPRDSFLLGSGASAPAGMPSVTDITGQVLSGDGAWRHSDGNYYLEGRPPFPEGDIDPQVAIILPFLEELKRVAASYAAASRVSHNPSYEDLYFLALQIHQSETREFENPALQPFIDHLQSDRALLPDSHDPALSLPSDLQSLAWETLTYIRCTVWLMLLRVPLSLSHLSPILEQCSNSSGLGINVFTLNHDTLIEQAMASRSIQYDDGFARPVNGVRYWHPKFHSRESSRVRVLKLHGSVNWFAFPPNESSPGVEAIGIPEDWDFWHTRNPRGALQWPLTSTPEFLAGTLNKMYSYASGIYADIYHHFRVMLRETRRLIVVGYGFGDKAINTQLIEWTYESQHHVMTFVHPNPDALRSAARPAIAKNWGAWLATGTLRLLQKPIETTTGDELAAALRE